MEETTKHYLIERINALEAKVCTQRREAAALDVVTSRQRKLINVQQDTIQYLRGAAIKRTNIIKQLTTK